MSDGRDGVARKQPLNNNNNTNRKQSSNQQLNSNINSSSNSSSTSSVSSSDSNEIKSKLSDEDDDQPSLKMAQPTTTATATTKTIKMPAPGAHTSTLKSPQRRPQQLQLAPGAGLHHNRSPLKHGARTSSAGSSSAAGGGAGGLPEGASASGSSRRTTISSHLSSSSKSLPITREQLVHAPTLKSGEVELMYRSPDSSSSLDRHLKDEQAKQVAPNLKQSPIAIMSINPTYQLQNKPLILEYPATVENLRLNNTGFSWEVKMPYQISMTTALFGAHLSSLHRYRLDQFHCHWGETDLEGSEHTVDGRSYSAELHFVHYNMEKYHTFSKAARHPDGLVVLSVFVEALEDHHNHAEFEKIVSHLKQIQLKGQHSIIKQAIRIDNLLPSNRSYWSYQGSLTTPPYLESVTWFILRHPIRCSRAQLDKCRSLKSAAAAAAAQTSQHQQDARQLFIKTNHRRPQPLNGRTVVKYDEP